MTKFGPIRRKRPRYAPKRVIDRAVEAVRANGIHVASVTFSPDGTIKLSAIDEPIKPPSNLFDTLDKEGRV